MSILKKLIATAGVFALASASLVSANAAAPVLVVTNKPTDVNNYSVCTFKKSSAQSGSVKIENLSNVSVVNTNGDVYSVYINNSSACFPLVNATPIASSEIVLVNGHTTEVNLANYSAATAAVASTSLYNEIPTLTSVVTPKGTYTGSNATLCQGNSGAVKIAFSDINENDLTGAVTLGGTNFQGTPTVDTSVKGKVTITVFPTTTAVANTAGFSATFTASDAFTPTASVPAPNVSVTPGTFTKAINFSVVSDCTSTTVASSSSSSVSSMSSSSMMSSSSATVVASSTVAASSKAPVTEVAAAPMADSAKGSTVRTGGVN